MKFQHFTTDEVKVLCQEALQRLNTANQGREDIAPPVAWEDAYGKARGFWVELIHILLNDVLPEKEDKQP